MFIVDDAATTVNRRYLKTEEISRVRAFANNLVKGSSPASPGTLRSRLVHRDAHTDREQGTVVIFGRLVDK